MKIVHLCLANFYIDNFGYQENLLPKYHKKQGHDVTIIASRINFNTNDGSIELTNSGEYINSNDIKVIRTDYKYKLPLIINRRLRIYKNTYKLLKKENPDLIFMHGIQFIDMKKVIDYVKKNNCKVVADTHATHVNSASNFLSAALLHKTIYKSIIQNSLNYIDKIFAIAPAAKKFAKDMYDIPNSKMEYLYLGADTDEINFDDKEIIKDEIRNDLNFNKNDFVLITGGKLTKRKRAGFLLKSFKDIKDKDLKLIIFGSFSEELKYKMMKKIKSDKRIRYIGWLESSEVYNYYLASDVAVFPGGKSALWEQAITTGLPLICRKWKGMDYVDVGGNCIFINNNKNELIKSIKLLKSDETLYDKMSKIAKNKGYEKFSYDKIARRAINLNIN